MVLFAKPFSIDIRTSNAHKMESRKLASVITMKVKAMILG